MSDKALKRLGVKIEACSECGKRFSFSRIPPHNVVVFDPETGEPYDDDTGYFCSEGCGKTHAARRTGKGEHVAYHFMDPKRYG